MWNCEGRRSGGQASGGQGGGGWSGNRFLTLLRAAALVLLVLSQGRDLPGQTEPSDSTDRPTARPPDRLTVYLMTMGPGKQV